MKQPDECQNMEDIRCEIDAIDSTIIKLISKRAGYVHAAAKFKKDENAVKAPERVSAMLEDRRKWAMKNGLEPGFIEGLFKGMVAYFTSQEMKTWQKDL